MPLKESTKVESIPLDEVSIHDQLTVDRTPSSWDVSEVPFLVDSSARRTP
jgi:hypothetical protein